MEYDRDIAYEAARTMKFGSGKKVGLSTHKELKETIQTQSARYFHSIGKKINILYHKQHLTDATSDQHQQKNTLLSSKQHFLFRAVQLTTSYVQLRAGEFGNPKIKTHVLWYY